MHPMRAVGIAVFLAAGCLMVASGQPSGANACSGRYLEFADALALSNGAVYSGRVTRAEAADTFWIDMTIDIDHVVRGPAAGRIRRAQAGIVCDGIRANEYGYVVRGVLDPLEPPSDERLDLFFRISTTAAEAALQAAGMPITSTAPSSGEETRPIVPLAWLGLWSATAFVLAAYRLRGRRRDDPLD